MNQKFPLLSPRMAHWFGIGAVGVLAGFVLILSTGEAGALLDAVFRQVPVSAWTAMLAMLLTGLATHTLTPLLWHGLRLAGRYAPGREQRAAMCWLTLGALIVVLAATPMALFWRERVAALVPLSMPVITLFMIAALFLLGLLGLYPVRLPRIDRTAAGDTPLRQSIDACAAGMLVAGLILSGVVPVVHAVGFSTAVWAGMVSGLMATMSAYIARPAAPESVGRRRRLVRGTLAVGAYALGLVAALLSLLGVVGTLMVVACVALIALKLWLFYHHRLFGQPRIILPIIAILMAIALIVPRHVSSTGF